MVVSLYWNPSHPTQPGALFELLDIRTTPESIRKINLVAIHPTVKTWAFSPNLI
jgi:hypothetical protein